jgi:hypothetical protein
MSVGPNVNGGKMKNILIVLILGGFAANPVMAAPKTAAAATAVAPATVKPEVAVAPPNATAKGDSLGFGNAKFSVSAWGGLSLTVAKGTHEKDFETVASNSGLSQKVTTGSPAFGGTAWYGNSANAVGIEAGYSTVYKNVSGSSGTTYTYQLSLIGIQALYRYDIFEGLYAAAGAGIAIASLTSENTAIVTANLKSSIAPLFSGRVGYDYAIMPNLIAGAYVQFSYALINITDNLGSGSQTYAAGNFAVSPIAQLTYKF